MITVWAIWEWSPEAFGLAGSIFSRLISEFETKYPSQKIEYRSFTSIAHLREQFLAQASTPYLRPDVILADSFMIGEFASKKLIKPLDPFISINLTRDLYPFALEGVCIDGHIYSIWYTTDIRLLIYRRDLLKKAGISSPPETWDEFREVAKKLTTDDIYGIGFGAGKDESCIADLILPWFYSLGGELVDTKGNPVFYKGKNRENLVRILEFLYQLIYVDRSASEKCSQIRRSYDVLFQYISNKVAMWLGGSWDYERIMSGDFDIFLRTGFAPTPMPEDGKPLTTISGGWAFAISEKDSGQEENAWKFIQWMTSPENMAEVAFALKQFPTRRSALWLGPIKSDPFYDLFQKLLPHTGFRPSWCPLYPKISESLQTALQRVLTKEMTPEKAIDEAEVTISYYI